MSHSDIYYLNYICLNCRGINQLVTDNISSQSVVRCSHCNVPLGALHELVEKSQNQSGGAGRQRAGDAETCC